MATEYENSQKLAAVTEAMEQLFIADEDTDVSYDGTSKPSFDKRFAQIVDDYGNIADLTADAEAAAANAAGSAEAAASSGEVYASTADALSNGVYSLDSLVAGSGGTDGTFALAFSDGGGSDAAGWFTVVSGAVSAYGITARGRGYTSAPTVSFAASSGLSGASATAVIAANRDVGHYFNVQSTSYPGFFDPYIVESGPVATLFGESSGAQIARDSADIGVLLDATTVAQDHGIDTTATGTDVSAGSTRFNNIPTTYDSYLRQITLTVGVAGTFIFKRISKAENGQFVTEETITTIALDTGEQTLYADQFSGIDFGANEYLAVYSLVGKLEYGASGDSYSITGSSTGTQTFFTSAAKLLLNPVFVSKKDEQYPQEDKFGRALVSGLGASVGNTRVANIAGATAGSILTAVELYVQSGTGTGLLYVLEPTGETDEFIVANTITISGITTGLNRYDVDQLVVLTASTILGFYSDDVQLAFTSGGSDYSLFAKLSGTVTLTSSTNTFRIRGVYLESGSMRYTAEYAKLLATTLQNASAPSASAITNDGNIVRQSLADALPAGWDVNGATWSFGSTGARATGSGAVDHYLVWDSQSSLDRSKVTLPVIITDETSKFAVIARGLSVSGTFVEIDCDNEVINLYNEWNSAGSLPYIAESFPFGFSVVTGRRYSITMSKDIDERNAGEFQTYTELVFTDTITGDSVTAKRYYPNGGMHWGNVGVQFSSGDITIPYFTYASLMPRHPHISVMGHSFVEGNAISDTRHLRYSQLAVDSVDGNGMISGMGGATSANLLARLDADLDPFAPTYVFIDIITNDSVYATWLANVESIIARVEALGGTPILLTAPPRADRQSFIDSANAWVRGRQYFVDQAAALCSDYPTCVTWRAGMKADDDIHPTILGYAATHAQMLRDAPYAFIRP